MLGNQQILIKLKGIRLATCPPATKDIPTNLKNRQKCIDEAHYGPLNPNEPNEDYWIAKAKMFGGSDVDSAKKALCGNCSFFNQTKKILDCISEGIGVGKGQPNPFDTIEAGDLGYCEAFDFKCASKRTCDAWVTGGPITDTELDIEPNPCWEGYEPIGLKPNGDPNCVPIKLSEQFANESYSDYPDGVKNNAKRALEWADKNGWGSCGTPVGKQRANQLAKGEAISIDTIKRMYSYVSRHEKDLDSSKSYSDGCGKLMMDSWGGLGAGAWAHNKLKELGIISE